MKKLTATLLPILLICLLGGLTPARAASEVTGEDVLVNAQNFPDPNFLDYVKTLPGAEDGILTQKELSSCTVLDVSMSSHASNNLKIRDLNGVQYFTALTKLNCGGNLLDNLDISRNLLLEELDISCNPMTALDVSHNPVLAVLNTFTVPLTALNLSQNPKLTRLVCWGSDLRDLDVSHNLELTYLDVADNQLTTLDLSKNVVLTDVDCTWNPLKELILPPKPSMKKVLVDHTFLAALTFAPHTELTEFSYQGVQRSVPAGTVISALPGFDSSKVTAMEGGNFDGGMVNYDLDVDTIHYTYDCGAGRSAEFILTRSLDVPIDSNYFPDSHFRDFLLRLPEGADWVLTGQELQGITKLDCSGLNVPDGEKICDLTGIEHFFALTTLDCSNNALSELDVSQCQSLQTLACSYNPGIRHLDISSNKALTRLECDGLQLQTLDVTHNHELTQLWCNLNALSALDVSGNPKLKDLKLDANQITRLDITQNTLLTELNCWGNQLTELDVSRNAKLTWLFCGANQIRKLDLRNNPELTFLDCPDSQLSALDLSQQKNLLHVSCDGNRLSVEEGAAVSLLPGFDPARVISVEGGGFENGTVRYAPGSDVIHYTYDCGAGKNVEFTLTRYPDFIPFSIHSGEIVLRPGRNALAGTVIAAAYDAQGRLLFTGSAKLDGSGDSAYITHQGFDTASAVRLFYLNAQNAPDHSAITV